MLGIRWHLHPKKVVKCKVRKQLKSPKAVSVWNGNSKGVTKLASKSPQSKSMKSLFHDDYFFYYYYSDMDTNESAHWNWKICNLISPISFPTDLPVLSPTMLPSISAPPSMIKRKKSPWCQSLSRGEIYKTNLDSTSIFKYELLSITSMAMNKILSNVESKLTTILQDLFLDCNGLAVDKIGKHIKFWKSRRSVVSLKTFADMSKITLRKKQRELEVNGVDINPPAGVDSSSSCFHLVEAFGETCYVVNGWVTLYLREDSPESSKFESAQYALKAIKMAMNGLDILDPSMGIMGLYYLGGSIDGVAPEKSSSVVSTAAVVQSSQIKSQEMLSGAGISIITVAGVVIVGVAFILMKKNKSTDVNITERYVEEDISLSHDWNKNCFFPGSISRSDDEDTELVSIISSVAGSGCTRGNKGPLYNDLEADRYCATLDVHQCQSLICQICNERRICTEFLTSDVVLPVEQKDIDRRGIAQKLGSRLYHVDNTVEI